MKEYLPLVLERRKMQLKEQENITAIDIDDLQINSPTRVPLTYTSSTSNVIILSDEENNDNQSPQRKSITGATSTAQTILKARQAINARADGLSLNSLFCKTKKHPSKSELSEYLRHPLGMFYYNGYYCSF
jgi:hypothetical protein